MKMTVDEVSHLMSLRGYYFRVEIEWLTKSKRERVGDAVIHVRNAAELVAYLEAANPNGEMVPGFVDVFETTDNYPPVVVEMPVGAVTGRDLDETRAAINVWTITRTDMWSRLLEHLRFLLNLPDARMTECDRVTKGIDYSKPGLYWCNLLSRFGADRRTNILPLHVRVVSSMSDAQRLTFEMLNLDHFRWISAEETRNAESRP